MIFCLGCLLHGPAVEISGLSAAEPPKVVGFLNAGDSLRHVWVDNLAKVQILLQASCQEYRKKRGHQYLSNDLISLFLTVIFHRDPYKKTLGPVLRAQIKG